MLLKPTRKVLLLQSTKLVQAKKEREQVELVWVEVLEEVEVAVVAKVEVEAMVEVEDVAEAAAVAAVVDEEAEAEVGAVDGINDT